MSQNPVNSTNILGKALGILTLIIAFYVGYYFYVLERWEYINSLNPENFKETKYSIRYTNDIPTTFYSVGLLGKVLRKWPHGMLHLFRVDPRETFEFDSSIINSSVVARKLDPTCQNIRLNNCSRKSVISSNCLFELSLSTGEEEVIDASSILSNKKSGYQAQFAKLHNRETVQRIWNSLKLPFSVKDTTFEHAFISNLKKNEMTAVIHGNPVTDSMAVQFVGKKTWLFFPPSTYINGMKATSGGGALFPKRAPPPETNPELLVYTSKPGDVLFFPESWGHTVHTYPGPNLLMNFRKFYYGNILRQPLIWLSSIIEIKLEGKANMNKDNEAGKAVKNQEISAVPHRKNNVRIGDMHNDLCEKGRTGFDAQLLSILDEEVDREMSS